MKWLYPVFFKKHSEDITPSQLSLLSSIGLIYLLLGLSCTLFKYAHHLWPLITVGGAGFFLTLKAKKRGFALSVFLLMVVDFFNFQEPLWSSLLSVCIALSWLLLFLGHQEVLAFLATKEQLIQSLRETQTELSAQLQQRKSLLLENQEGVREALKKAEEQLLALHAELEERKNKQEQLSVEITSYQRKEKAFQCALEDAQSQLLKWKYNTEEAKSSSVEQKSADVWEIHYTQLKEQFEEKSEILHQTRKQLFNVEGELWALQKEVEEQACNCCAEDAAFVSTTKKMEEEREELEHHILALEQFISSLLYTKAKAKPRRKKNSAEGQAELFFLLPQETAPLQGSGVNENLQAT